MKTLRAYIVQHEDDGSGGIIYAKTNAQARREGANEYACGEFHFVTCRRAPEFDGLQNDPRERTRLLLAKGWWFDTSSGLLTGDDEPWVSKAGEVYRNPFEWLAEREEEAQRERLRKEWERRLWERWWFAEDIHVRIEPCGYANADIRLPYMRDPLRMLEHEGYRHTVTRRDLPIWQQAYCVNRDGDNALVRAIYIRWKIWAAIAQPAAGLA